MYDCCAHVLGISKSIEYGEFSASMASIAMSLSAILGSLVGPFLVGLVAKICYLIVKRGV
ncbi:LrgB family protein [Paenibacillus sabinae]|uniref:LrgB family protein n=1 Tax=Paenibacillus sabinae TaxID=365617 RepID=UPI001185286F|nr:LrgB family protein [Paenibacillus sabinae]